MAVIEHGSNEEKDLTWLDFAYNPRLSADGSEILFTDQTGQSGSQYNVYVRKRDGSPAVRIGENGFGSDITADGRFALLVKADDPQMPRADRSGRTGREERITLGRRTTDLGTMVSRRRTHSAGGQHPSGPSHLAV